MEFKKRQMLLLPEVNPNSFVFFFERGNSGASWSIRDYSIGNHVAVYRPGDFPWTADEIFQKARHALNAPTHHTEDLAFWHKHTIELNNQYGANTAASSVTLPHRKPETLLRIARNLTILLWSDFKALVCGLGAEPATTGVE